MKKCSHLRKILIIATAIEAGVFLLNSTNAKAVHSYTNISTIYKEKYINDDGDFNKYCNDYASALDMTKESEDKKSDVVKCAYKLIGKPYVYGASGPNEFDCSGLTQYVYKSTGKNISRTTYTQVKEGVEVSKKDLKPGDLVFFNTSSYMSHVGIYVGNGSFIHAPRTGKPVTISTLNEGYYCERFATARRIIN